MQTAKGTVGNNPFTISNTMDCGVIVEYKNREVMFTAEELVSKAVEMIDDAFSKERFAAAIQQQAEGK